MITKKERLENFISTDRLEEIARHKKAGREIKIEIEREKMRKGESKI